MAIKFVDSILKLSAIHKVRHSLFKQHVFLLAICFYCKFFHLLPMVVVAHLHFMYSIESISNKRACISCHIWHLQYGYSVTLDVIKFDWIRCMIENRNVYNLSIIRYVFRINYSLLHLSTYSISCIFADSAKVPV